jgi:hypothetical protein
MDTSPEVEERIFEIYRAMPLHRKVDLLRASYRTGRLLHAAGYLRRNPGASNRQIQVDWIRRSLGFVPAVIWPEDERMAASNADNLPPLKAVLEAFRHMGLAFAVGGSWASSIHGESRLSNDADVTVEPFPGREDEFGAHFDADYYVSVDAVRQANQGRSTFNVLHTPSGFKVDVFIQKPRAYDQMLMRRRVIGVLPEAPAEPLEVVSPEDSILLKLEWFRLGGEVSDQQLRDVRGILKTQTGRLDDAYLDHWAADIGVSDLLAQARADAAAP